MPSRLPFRSISLRLLLCLLPAFPLAASADSPPPLPFDTPNYGDQLPDDKPDAAAPAAKVEPEAPREETRCVKKTVKVKGKRKTIEQCSKVKSKAAAKEEAPAKSGSRKGKASATSKGKAATKATSGKASAKKPAAPRKKHK